MSSGPGTPIAGGYMRQRHSPGSASSGDDLEDDACSRLQPFSLPTPGTRTWFEILEDVLWVASLLFIIYFGDRHSNFIYLLCHDDRIRRLPLYLGLACVGVDIAIFFYTSMLAWRVRRFDEKWELSTISALPFMTLLGLVSFCLLSFALWPIWSFLTLPLMFTLFMACMVILPHLIGRFRSQNDVFRID